MKVEFVIPLPHRIADGLVISEDSMVSSPDIVPVRDEAGNMLGLAEPQVDGPGLLVKAELPDAWPLRLLSVGFVPGPGGRVSLAPVFVGQPGMDGKRRRE